MREERTAADRESVESTQDESGEGKGLLMAYLIDKERVLEAIDEVEGIKGYEYLRLLELIREIPVQVVERDCRGCFGASFGDCEECEQYKYVSVRTEIQRRLVAPIDKFDNAVKEYIGVVDEWVQYFKSERNKHARKVRTLWQRIKRVR